jgi:L-lactate dehydrogenase
MVCARIAEVILGDERAVFPVGSYNPRFGTTVSLPSLERGAARLRETVHKYLVTS